MNDPSNLTTTAPEETAKAWAIPHFGVLGIRGEDAVSFLQGQLCNDVRRLDRTHAQLTGLSDARGRLQAIAYALSPQPDTIELILPRELLQPVAAILGRYVLRARVEITDVSDATELATVPAAAAAAWLADRDVPQPGPGSLAVTAAAGARLVRLPGAEPQYLLCQTPGDHPIATDSGERWELQRIRAGDPTVFTATRGLFVAQMTNLDILGGVSFEKGCYTGQEVIARTQHRGKIKRRMFRFAIPGGDIPDPGAALMAAGRKVGNVVRSAGSECLGVVRTDALADGISVELGGIMVALEPLSLPYAVADA